VLYDTTLGWRFPNPRLEERFPLETMGETGENVAERWSVSREEQDAFALRSQQRWVAATDAGRFDDELVPVGDVTRDEHPRPDTTAEKLAALKPAFRAGGTVTAGNSSPLNDGAAALLVVSREYAQAHGLARLARIRSVAVAGVPPRTMGIGPVPAARKALERAHATMAEVDRIELNEAFAAQSLAVLAGWGVDAADPRVNASGGAIALGHPLGCSGARILTTLVHGMHRAEERLGLAAMCIGVGQGIAMVVER
jgi:acetyl-CoA acyltransferase